MHTISYSNPISSFPQIDRFKQQIICSSPDVTANGYFKIGKTLLLVVS
jgi:hypothetical protein